MRKVANVRKLEDIRLMRHDLAKSFNQMFSRDRIERSVNEQERLVHLLQGLDPSLAVAGAFAHIPDQLVDYSLSAVDLKEFDVLVQLLFCRLCSRPKNGREAGSKPAIRNKPAE